MFGERQCTARVQIIHLYICHVLNNIHTTLLLNMQLFDFNTFHLTMFVTLYLLIWSASIPPICKWDFENIVSIKACNTNHSFRITWVIVQTRSRAEFDLDFFSKLIMQFLIGKP